MPVPFFTEGPDKSGIVFVFLPPGMPGTSCQDVLCNCLLWEAGGGMNGPSGVTGLVP